MPQQDPWADFRVGAPQPQAPQYPGIIKGAQDPYKQAAEQRAQQDQGFQAQGLAIQQERLRLTQEEEARKRGKEASGFDATEGERKAGAFLIRALGANDSYEATGIGPRSYVGQAMQDVAPGLLNQLPAGVGNSPERQTADSAQNEFIAASLRQDSGAAIPPEELERQRQIYFPMPGDSPEAIEQKRQARLRAIEGLRQSSGRLLEQSEARYAAMREPNAKDGSELGNRVGNALEQIAPPRAENGVSPEDALAFTVSRWGGEFYGPDGNPLGPDGGPGYNKNGDFIGMFGSVTDETPAPPETKMDQLGTATAVTAKGAAKAVTGLYDLGMDAASAVRSGVNYAVGKGGGALLDAVGAEGAADWWRQGSEGVQQNINNMPTASGALDNIYPTPPGYEAGEFAATIAAGLALPGPKRANVPRAPGATLAVAPSTAREVIKAGKDAGVRVMTSDVRPPKTFTGKILRATGERIPYAGTAGPRAAQQEERIKAVRDLAQDFGADIAGEYLDDIADDLARTRGGQIAGLTRAKDAVIDSVQAPFVAERTAQAIDEQVARLRGINEGAFAPVIQQLEAFKANILSGKTLRQVEGNRKLLGDMFSAPNLAAIKGDGQKAINAIYGPLREDMAAFIKQHAGEQALTRWAKANERLAGLAGELDSAAFRNVLKNAEVTPEQVGRLLSNRNPSEVRRLYSNLSPAGQAKARAGIIAMAIDAAGGLEKVSPDQFANAIARNSKAAGVVFEGADLARLEGLQRLLQATKQASVASAAPPTGVQNSQLLGGYLAGASGPVSLPLIASIGGLARLYESAATRNLLIGLSKTQPNSKAESQWIERIMRAAATQTERMSNAANDVMANSPGRVAAQDEQNAR